MTTFSIAPDFSAQVTIKPMMYTASFGDGYTQRTGNGVNKIQEVWPLTFSGRTLTERNALIAFFETQGGIYPFDWTSPNGTIGRWICSEWTDAPTGYQTWTVTAKFTQDFAP